MVSELAGEGAMPPQLPAPASRSLETAVLRFHLRKQIRRGSLLRRGVNLTKTIALFSPSFNRSRSVKFLSKVLNNPMFEVFYRSRSVKSSSRVLDPPSVAIRVHGADPWNERVQCSLISLASLVHLAISSCSAIHIQSLSKVLISSLFTIFTRSRSVKSSSAELVVIVSSPQRRTREKKQLLTLVRDFASEKSQRERRISNLKNRIGDFRSSESLSVVLVNPPCVIILVNMTASGEVRIHLFQFDTSVANCEPIGREFTLGSATIHRTEPNLAKVRNEIEYQDSKTMMLCFVLDLRCLSPPLLRDLEQSLLQVANFNEICSASNGNRLEMEMETLHLPSQQMMNSRMLCHVNTAGDVIGNNSFGVRHLEKQTGCRIVEEKPIRNCMSLGVPLNENLTVFFLSSAMAALRILNLVVLSLTLSYGANLSESVFVGCFLSMSSKTVVVKSLIDDLFGISTDLNTSEQKNDVVNKLRGSLIPYSCYGILWDIMQETPPSSSKRSFHGGSILQLRTGNSDEALQGSVCCLVQALNRGAKKIHVHNEQVSLMRTTADGGIQVEEASFYLTSILSWTYKTCMSSLPGGVGGRRNSEGH